MAGRMKILTKILKEIDRGNMDFLWTNNVEDDLYHAATP